MGPLRSSDCVSAMLLSIRVQVFASDGNGADNRSLSAYTTPFSGRSSRRAYVSAERSWSKRSTTRRNIEQVELCTSKSYGRRPCAKWIARVRCLKRSWICSQECSQSGDGRRLHPSHYRVDSLFA